MIVYLEWDPKTLDLLDWVVLPNLEVKKIGNRYCWKEFTFESFQIWDTSCDPPDKEFMIVKKMKEMKERRQNGHRSRRYEKKTVRRRQK